MSESFPRIRPAVPDDAAHYARAAAQAFVEAYLDDTNRANIDRHLAREFSEAKQRRELQDPAITVLAAFEQDGEPHGEPGREPTRAPGGAWAGFAALRAGARADGVTAERPMEIARFYLRARWYGRGLARPLMEAALAHARARGHDGVWLQVWEHNARARRFYEKCGFVAVGSNPFLFGDTPEDDVVYQVLFGPARDRAG